MEKSTKPILRLLCALAASWVGSTAICPTAAQAQSKQPKPAAMPAPTSNTTYTFYQGIIFQPFPGTIPRAAVGSNGNSPAPYPIVEVPTPGLRAEGTTPRQTTTRRKTTAATPPPIRRRIRTVPIK